MMGQAFGVERRLDSPQLLSAARSRGCSTSPPSPFGWRCIRGSVPLFSRGYLRRQGPAAPGPVQGEDGEADHYRGDNDGQGHRHGNHAGDPHRLDVRPVIPSTCNYSVTHYRPFLGCSTLTEAGCPCRLAFFVRDRWARYSCTVSQTMKMSKAVSKTMPQVKATTSS